MKDARRAATYWSAFAPALAALEHAPWPVVRATLRRVLEPAAHLATRKKSLQHLAKVYGDTMPAPERERIARRVTHNFVRELETVLRALREGPESVLAEVEDAAALARLHGVEKASARGFIGVTGHIGNWEVLGGWFAQRSLRGAGAAIGRRHPDRRLNARIESMRRRLGLETLYRDDPPTRPIRILREGRGIAMVPDQDIKNLAGVFVDFLGHRAYTPLGPARLALAAGAPIMCGYFYRDADGRPHIQMNEPIWPDRTADRAVELERLTRAWCAEVEAMIRLHPDQWAWFHERWRTTPEHLAARGRRELQL